MSDQDDQRSNHTLPHLVSDRAEKGAWSQSAKAQAQANEQDTSVCWLTKEPPLFVKRWIGIDKSCH